MATNVGDEVELATVTGEDDAEELSLIGLSSPERGRLSRPLGSASRWDNALSPIKRYKAQIEGILYRGQTPDGSSSTTRHLVYLAIVFVLLLAGVFHLGRLEAKKEVGGGGIDAYDVGKAKSTSKVGAFTRGHLEATRVEANKVLTLLEEYYFGKDKAYDMLMKSWLDPWEFDEVHWPEKHDRNAKLVDTLARALVTDEQKTFLVGAIGSSVMAGHDNCHYDSYQAQMERLWQPVWEAAGMNFVFQNAGEGGGCGDSFQNQGFCITQNVSPNVDIVHWSWTYFGEASKEVEALVRWTQLLPKQPPVHQFNTGNIPGGESQLAKHYAKYSNNCFYMRTALENGGHDYESERNREVDPFDRFGWGYVGDGYHNMTRYGERETDDVRKNSLGVVMRNWHPGPMGFQITSDAFTYVYTQALLIALDLIETDMNDGKDPRDTWSASKRQPLLKTDLPTPILCDPEYCVVDEPPKCLNFELPTFGKPGASVEDPGDKLNPYKDHYQNWTVWHAPNDLWYMVDQDDISFFQHRPEKDVCRHLDACGGISAQSVYDGMVVFRLPKMSVGLVIICGMSEGRSAADMFINNTAIEISYNTVPVNPEEMDIYPWAGKCTRVMKRFPTSGRQSETPTGHAYLAVNVLTDMEKPFRITQVITL